MKTKPNVVAIIPARGGSTGIPRKNLKDFGGKPLVAHTIQQALSAKTITNVFVNSEDSEIRDVAATWRTSDGPAREIPSRQHFSRS